MSKPLLTSFLLASIAAFPLLASAQQQNEPATPAIPIEAAPAPATDHVPLRNIEATIGAQHLTGGNGPWRSLTVRGTYEAGSHMLQAELSSAREFHESGNFFGFTDTVTFNPDWYAAFSIGAGDGAFYYPRIRSDVTVYRKLLEKRNLVASVGGGYYNAPDGHIDRNLAFGLAYYFDMPLVAEMGVRFNRSNPGPVNTHQQFVAATYGKDKQDLVSARYGWGGESYQTIGDNVALVDFQSKDLTVTWRHWLDRASGVVLTLEHYRNPSYVRSGIETGIFHQF